MIKEFVVGQLYSNEEVFKTLKVANAGGVRLSVQDKIVIRAAIMTSFEDFHQAGENPYHDRLEGEILTYTAAGKVGEQTLSGINNRIIEQKKFNFPIHGFVLIASRRDKTIGSKRWKYLGLLEYLKHYLDNQIDTESKVRKVWIFEFKIHEEPQVVPLSLDINISNQKLKESKLNDSEALDDEIINDSEDEESENIKLIEQTRGKLLIMEPRKFEFLIKNLLVHTGFKEVCVTKYSADGGVDVNAKTGNNMWIFEDTFVQIQAKRWLHSVGRKEVAELRGSLQPFARGAVITTSHFSRSAINEATEEGKKPIALVDGYRFSKIIIEEQFSLNE
tara:strand:- start:1019 stop:2017 length:999 start_codon:yes stop_codon:yes gene_type:complete